MFEAAEIGRSVAKEDYDREAVTLREELLELQLELRRADFPVIIVIGGVDGAGKGETVNTLLAWLDPRHVETFALGAMTEEERERPTYWRFWRALPPRGKIGIFFGGWHSAPIVERAYKQIKDAELDRQLGEVVRFERLLAAEGVLLLKFWMHLSKARQRKRLRALEKDKRTRWRVTPTDWDHFAIYDRFARISSHALRRTSTAEAPWTIVEATDRRYQILTVARELRDRLRAHLAARVAPAARIEAGTAAAPPGAAPAPGEARTILSSLDMTRTLDDDAYARRLEACQGRLNLLCREAKRDGVSTVIVYEGVDAAGKGGNIRRVTGALDARMYTIVPIAAPTAEERRYPYLWRFWRHLPRAGRITIFDRSWYGRVLVERVEGFCRPADWARAYTEINDFEEQLARRGTVIVKLWLHITQDEQLRRFEERAATPFKRFKITDEDWRNRDKWPAYAAAINEMVERTSTELAPWTLVEGNCKRHARIKTLETIADAVAARL
ncbi:MAG: polyphosphate:AMP phosphotransferase [Myxococcales bacterium]|nr:polyphosphate:AMP phosphotransferase [Myxococcales bacterium]